MIVNASWKFGKIAHHPILSAMAKYYLKYMPTRSVVSLEKKLNDLSYLNH